MSLHSSGIGCSFISYIMPTKTLKKAAFFSVVAILGVMLLSSCCTTPLITERVHYQSVRKVYRYDNEQSANIIVGTNLSADGTLEVVVQNMSDEIMTIDMVRSFVVTTSGKSISYYDPTVRVESSTDISSTTTGATVNVGAVAGALGVGGVVGQVLNGVNVGKSGTSGISNTTTTYFSEQPQVNLAPKGTGKMPKSFNVGGIGEPRNSIHCSYNKNEVFSTHTSANKKFSVCLSYSIDGGNTWRKYEQWFYVNSELCVPVANTSLVNNAVRTILQTKTDAVNEPWWIMFLENNYIPSTTGNINEFVDYQ